MTDHIILAYVLKVRIVRPHSGVPLVRETYPVFMIYLFIHAEVRFPSLIGALLLEEVAR